MLRIRHLRGGILALQEIRMGRLRDGFWGGLDGSAGLAAVCPWIALLVAARVLFFVSLVVFSPGGFRDVGKFGFSGQCGFEFGSGVGELAADGALETVDGEHDAVAGDRCFEGPLEDVLVDAEDIAEA